MKIRTILTSFVILAFASVSSAGQSTDSNDLRLKGSSSKSMLMGGGRSDIVRESKMDIRDIPVQYGKEYDQRMKDLEEDLEEKNWSDDKSSWERACELNTKASYQKYCNRFPDGLHRGEAEQKIIDFEVEDIMNREHNDLPEMKHIEENDDSPSSTIVVENHTEYTLTVMYSGFESKVIKIPAGGKQSVTLTNGYYRIAASVPPSFVRPYAGNQLLSGGKYETGYWINWGYR